MGGVLGLMAGLGLFLLVSTDPQRARPVPRSARWRRDTEAMLERAEVRGVTPGQLLVVSLVLGTVVGALVLVISSTIPLAAVFGIFAASAPRTLLVRRAQRLTAERRGIWPELVDDLASAVRAGLSLPEAVCALAGKAPDPLRTHFQAFAEAHRMTGSFSRCLDQLAADLADPVGDRVIEALRMAREVGGTDLGRLLRTLSTFLREDLRVRAELVTRQGWTVNAARLALAAPWVVLLLLSSQSSTVTAYNSVEGVGVLAVGGAVSGAAYLLMHRIGRLPEEARVLQ